MANMSWAFATLDFQCHWFFRSLARVAMATIRYFGGQELSNLAIAYGRLQYYVPGEMLRASHVQCNSILIVLMQLYGLVITITLSHCGSYCIVLHYTSSIAIDSRIAFRTSRSLVSLPASSYCPAELMEAIADECVSRGNTSDFSAQTIANILWAFATMRHFHAPLLDTATTLVTCGRRISDHMIRCDD